MKKFFESILPSKKIDNNELNEPLLEAGSQSDPFENMDLHMDKIDAKLKASVKKSRSKTKNSFQLSLENIAIHSFPGRYSRMR